MSAVTMAASEIRLLSIMEKADDHEIVAVGIVEVRSALRLVDAGLAMLVSESSTSVDKWGAGSIRVRLTPSN